MPEQLALTARTPEEQADIEARVLARQRAIAAARAQGHFVLRVIAGAHTVFLAIPKKHAGKPVPPVPGLDGPHAYITVDMLDGATYHPHGNPRHTPGKTVIATPPIPEETDP